jgi:nucleolar protein involved in exit from mitosis
LSEEQQNKITKLTQKLKEEEENYEKLISNRLFNNQVVRNNWKEAKRELVLKENEKRYKEQKENLMIKLHQNEEVLKERQKKREKEIEELKRINEEKQKRKEIVKENYLKKLEKRRQELSKKLKEEQEKQEAIEKQKHAVLEQKSTNQMIDQMKVHYFKELHYNMKVKNQIG